MSIRHARGGGKVQGPPGPITRRPLIWRFFLAESGFWALLGGVLLLCRWGCDLALAGVAKLRRGIRGLRERLSACLGAARSRGERSAPARGLFSAEAAEAAALVDQAAPAIVAKALAQAGSPQLSTAERLALLEAQPPAVRRASLELLDAITRPLTAREIERALVAAGASRSQRRKLAGALKGLSIVAIVPPIAGPIEGKFDHAD